MGLEIGAVVGLSVGLPVGGLGKTYVLVRNGEGGLPVETTSLVFLILIGHNLVSQTSSYASHFLTSIT